MTINETHKSYGVLSALNTPNPVPRPVRQLPNRSMGETEIRIPVFPMFGKAVRVYVKHQKSSSARKNKKRKMAYTHTKQYRESTGRRLQWFKSFDAIIDRRKTSMVIIDEADRA